MSFITYDLTEEKNVFAGNAARRGGMSNADKIFARSVVKRQLLVVKDLMALDETYPGMIDKDVVGGLYALYTLLEDNVQSVTSH